MTSDLPESSGCPAMKGREVRASLMLEDSVPPSNTDRSPGLEEAGYRQGWGWG